MQTKPTIEQARSPIPGVIPEPVSAHHDVEAANRGFAATPTVRGAARPPRSRGRSDLLANVLSVIRGAKRGASPPPKER